MSKSKIEWCEATWNPIYGCTPISPGCENCYAKAWHNRFKGGDFSINLRPDKLMEPLKNKKPTRYFVGAMTDIFHEDVPDGVLDEMFAIMALTSWHTFMVLTKRPERMKAYFNSEKILKNITFRSCLLFKQGFIEEENCLCHKLIERMFPFPNVWLGVTAENQEMAEKRIPILLKTPAAHRFVSVEPMLGAVWLENFFPQIVQEDNEGYVEVTTRGVDWVICGGESGRNARPVDPDWVLDLRYQCAEAEVPFFFKQWGGKNKAKSGRLIDGVEVMEYPEGMKND